MSFVGNFLITSLYRHTSKANKKLQNLTKSSRNNNDQKQPSRGVLRKRCSEKMQQIYRRTAMPKCNFNNAAKQLYWNQIWHECSPVILLPIFRILFPKNTSGRLLLNDKSKLVILMSLVWLRFISAWDFIELRYVWSS